MSVSAHFRMVLECGQKWSMCGFSAAGKGLWVILGGRKESMGDFSATRNCLWAIFRRPEKGLRAISKRPERVYERFLTLFPLNTLNILNILNPLGNFKYFRYVIEVVKVKNSRRTCHHREVPRPHSAPEIGTVCELRCVFSSRSAPPTHQAQSELL